MAGTISAIAHVAINEEADAAAQKNFSVED
jgi:hypothetical protein